MFRSCAINGGQHYAKYSFIKQLGIQDQKLLYPDRPQLSLLTGAVMTLRTSKRKVFKSSEEWGAHVGLMP